MWLRVAIASHNAIMRYLKSNQKMNHTGLDGEVMAWEKEATQLYRPSGSTMPSDKVSRVGMSSPFGGDLVTMIRYLGQVILRVPWLMWQEARG